MPPKDSSEKIHTEHIYDSLMTEDAGDIEQFKRPKVPFIPGGKTKSFAGIELVKAPDDKSDEILDPQVLHEALKGVLFKLAQEMGLKTEEAIYNPNFVRSVANSQDQDIAKFQLIFALAQVNLGLDKFVANRESSIEISDIAADYFKQLMVAPDPSPRVGEGQADYRERVRQARVVRSKCNAALEQTARMKLLAELAVDNTPPEALQTISDNFQRSLNAIEQLEEIMRSGLTDQQFLTWAAQLESISGLTNKGGNNGGPGSGPDIIHERQEVIHNTRARFILKVGQCLLDRELPWSGRIQDVRIAATDFAVKNTQNERIPYIALTCQFEYEPGKFIEITVLERPSAIKETNLETGLSTIREENATYVYVSRNPRTWMDVFGGTGPSGALNYDALGKATAIEGEKEQVPVLGARRVYHSDFAKYDKAEEQDVVIQKHLDKVVRVILSMQEEVLKNIRA